jgi:hypothetical protein
MNHLPSRHDVPADHPFSNREMDRTAQMLQYLDDDQVREQLTDRGLTPYNAWLCIKAAQLLLDKGFYRSKHSPL